MKKLLATIVAMLIACTLLAGCQTLDNHSHTPQTEWSSDGTNHYHKCTFDGCMVKLDFAPCTGGNATCTERAICEKCANPYGEALGHSHSQQWSKDEETHWHECVCGDKTNVSTHNWTAGDIPTIPGCTTAGKQSYFCACGATKQEDISATGHSYTHIVTAPTCEGAGYTTYTCSTCGDSYTENEVDALGHSYTSAITNPTCTTAGYTTHTCTICGDSYTDSKLDKLGHAWVKGSTIIPTCEQSGFTTYSCSTCGSSKQDDTVAPLDHSYSNGTCINCGANDPNYINPDTHEHNHTAVEIAPTCTQVGTTTYTCECGNTYTEQTSALGHIDENLDIDCDREGCTGKVAPKADSLLGLATANALGSKLGTDRKYYVVGKIVRYYTEGDVKNGIFWITDENGVELLIRMPKNEIGELHSTWKFRLLVGDTIKIYGKVGKFTTASAPKGYYPCVEGGILVEIISKHTCDFTTTPATCFEPAYCMCLASYGNALGHTDENCDSLCDRCTLPTDTVREVIKTHYDSIKDTANFDTTKGTATWKGTEFNVVVDKGTSSLNTNGTNHYRVQNNNNLTVSATNGKKIVALTFVSSGSTYVDELELFLQSAGYTFTTEGNNVTIKLEGVDSVTLANTSNKVARIAEIYLFYVDASAEA